MIVDHAAPGSVYILKNTITQRVYVGASRGLRERRLSHARNLKRGCHQSRQMQEDYDLLGEKSFVWSPLIHRTSQAELFRMESKMIFYLAEKVSLYNRIPKKTGLIIDADYELFAGFLHAYQAASFTPAFEITTYTPWCKPRVATND